MSEQSSHFKGTLELARDFVECSRSLELMLYAKWWRNPVRYMRRVLGVDKSVRESLVDIAHELSRRYKGVLLEVFRRNGIGSNNLARAITSLWVGIADGARTLSDHRDFSKLIWTAAIRLTSLPGTLSLKPKVMLRQFVDEMPTSDERGTLRALAYGEPGLPQEGTEALEILTRSYPVLHEQILNHLAEVEIFTDSAISSERAKSLTPPYVEYEKWLFRS